MGLFSSGTKTIDAGTQISDPWSVLPPEIYDDLISGSGINAEMLQDSEKLAEYLTRNPRKIVGMQGNERQALANMRRGLIDAEGLAGLAEDGLGAGLNDPVNYESQYTDDVVASVLANMQLQADRERAAREGEAAALGGTSNSRVAVGNAVAEQLNGMNFAEMEAKLRDEAFRFGVDSNFREREADLDDREFINQLATDNLARTGIGADWLKGYGAEERDIAQRAADEKRTAGTQAQSWLKSIVGSGPPTALGGGTTSGTNTVQTGSPFSKILGGAIGVTSLAGMLSDEAAKEGIEPLDGAASLDALREARPATYSYRAGLGHREDRHAGLIAQSLDRMPGAVLNGDDGFKRVDPYSVTATIVAAVQELDRKIESLGG